MDNNTQYSYNPYQQPQVQPDAAGNSRQEYQAAGGGKPQKTKKQHGFGVTLAKCTAIALVFGLVAGAAFTGVSYFGGRTLGIVQEQDSGKADTDGTDEKDYSGDTASGNTDKQLQQTSTGNAAELTDVSGIVDSVMPSIVAITNTGSVTYQNFWGQSATYPSESCGSGIIVDQDNEYLYIATNNHVVANAEALTVQFADGSTVSCEIKGTAEANDLAVVKVALSSIESDTLKQIKVATLGDSAELKVGEASIAIGNALGYGQSVTTGVISALGRTVTVTDSTTGTTTTNTNLIQTDAAINPGNSGGALLNTKGEVIGINSVKYSDTSVEGIGYAIPISDAMEIIEQLITREKVDESQSAYLGIQGQDVSSDVAAAYGLPEGIYVYQVIPGAAAEEAGIRKGDVITKVDGQQVRTMSQLKELLSYYSAGETVTVTLQRMTDDYQEMELTVTLGSTSSVQR